MKNSKLTTIKWILKIGILLTGVVLSIVHFIPGNGFTKLWSYLATIALPFAMDILRLFKVKISDRFEIAYLVFIIPAMILGIDFDVYKIIYPFDKFVHFFSGILAVFGAREVIDQSSARPKEYWFKFLWSVAFAAFVAAVWECFEFFCDQFLGQSMQQLIAPGVEDTMWDIVVGLLGGIVGTFFAFPPKGDKTAKLSKSTKK